MPDRTVAPPFNEIHEILIKRPEHHVLPNGLDHFVLQSGTQPVIKIDLVFSTGKYQEPKNGLAYFAGKILSEGVKNRSSKDIAEYIDAFGAHLDITPGMDRLEISLYSLTKHFHQLVGLLREMITVPTIPEQEFETLKNIRLQSLRINKEKNSFVATQLFRQSVFGPHHPYGVLQTEEDIADIDRQMVVDQVKGQIIGKPFTLISSGQFGPEIIDLIHKELGNIPVESLNMFETAPVESSGDRHVDKPSSVQTSIRMGGLTIPMRHEDYQSLSIMNELFGGYFGSRLMKNIREDKGLTYGIYSGIANLDTASYLVISADVMKSNKDAAIREIQSEIEKLQTTLVSQEELDTVRNVILGQIQASVNTPFELASKFKGLHFRQLTYDYYDRLFATIQTVTPEDIREMAQKYLDTGSFRTVTVG